VAQTWFCDVCELCFPTHYGLITVSQASVLAQTCKVPHVCATRRMKSGVFQSVEDVLIQALKSAPPATELSREAATHTGADLVAAGGAYMPPFGMYAMMAPRIAAPRAPETIRAETIRAWLAPC
jgi:hypothetical protein